MIEYNGCEYRPGLYYDKDYQIWIRPEPDGSLVVGMTDISQTIAGRILHVRVRRPGTARPTGKPVATIESGKWAGPVPNLFDCVIEAANPQVLARPALLNSDPYGAWVARVRPDAGAEQVLARLVTGQEAATGYAERCRREDIQCKRGRG